MSLARAHLGHSVERSCGIGSPRVLEVFLARFKEVQITVEQHACDQHLRFPDSLLLQAQKLRRACHQDLDLPVDIESKLDLWHETLDYALFVRFPRHVEGVVMSMRQRPRVSEIRELDREFAILEPHYCRTVVWVMVVAGVGGLIKR